MVVSSFEEGGFALRIISGSHRGRKIKSLQGQDTRPTLDYVREALFNILGPRVKGVHFVDVYAGTGAVGIEALSRGAKIATFIEKNPKAVKLIKENLRSLELLEKSRVRPVDALKAFDKMMEENIACDIIFMDPPYGKKEIHRCLEYLKSSTLINADTLLIAEYSWDETMDFQGFQVIKEKKYGKTRLSFLRSDEN